MLLGRPYRGAIAADRVREVMRAESGKAFDPRLVGFILEDDSCFDDLENDTIDEDILRAVIGDDLSAPASPKTASQTA